MGSPPSNLQASLGKQRGASLVAWAAGSAGLDPVQVQAVPRGSARALLGSQSSFAAPDGSGSCQLEPLAQAEASKQPIVQIHARQRVLAEVVGGAAAQTLAQGLESVLTAGALAHPHISLVRVQQHPAVAINGQVAFQVTPAVARGWSCNGELLAIYWANQLRLATGSAPLEFVQAQAMLHQLMPTEQVLSGEASWYGPYFHGRITATGEVFNQHDFTAAHKTLPFDTYVRVTNRKNGRAVIVRINDRGPYVGDRMIDLSHQAAQSLGGEEKGIIDVDAVILQPLGTVSQTVAQLP
jgi:rare lipoprotein A